MGEAQKTPEVRRTRHSHPSMDLHLLGALALLWATASWLEWFLVPALFPEVKGGFLHGLRFAPQLALLVLGNFNLFIALWLSALRSERKLLPPSTPSRRRAISPIMGRGWFTV
jgi:hypothetical protein